LRKAYRASMACSFCEGRGFPKSQKGLISNKLDWVNPERQSN